MTQVCVIYILSHLSATVYIAISNLISSSRWCNENDFMGQDRLEIQITVSRLWCYLTFCVQVYIILVIFNDGSWNGRRNQSYPRENLGDNNESSLRRKVWIGWSYAVHAALWLLPIFLSTQRSQIKEVVRASDHFGTTAVHGVGVKDAVAIT